MCYFFKDYWQDSESISNEVSEPPFEGFETKFIKKMKNIDILKLRLNVGTHLLCFVACTEDGIMCLVLW